MIRNRQKRGKYKYNTSGLLNFAQDSYLERTSRPIYAIVFLLPFIVFHEMGTILINTDILNQTPVRVVAFVWLQDFLEYIGLSSKFAWAAPALAVVVILVALQLASRKRWHFWVGDIWVMAVECILLAIPLIVLSVFLSSSAEAQVDIGQFDNGMVQIGSETATSCSVVTSDSLLTDTEAGGGEVKSSLLVHIVIGIGAGIYEELIFRLILICVLMILFQDVLGFSHRSAIVVSVLVSAGLFSAHHHIIFVNGQLSASSTFSWVEFGFRTIAGVYFAVIFATRGFGITAGTHAFYDIIAVFLNSIFSASLKV